MEFFAAVWANDDLARRTVRPEKPPLPALLRPENVAALAARLRGSQPQVTAAAAAAAASAAVFAAASLVKNTAGLLVHKNASVQHRAVTLPFDRSHRGVWMALCAHVFSLERTSMTSALSEGETPTVGTKSQILMLNAAIQQHARYAEYRSKLPKQQAHAIDDKLESHQDQIQAAVAVEFTKAFGCGAVASNTFFSLLEKQHGMHWRLPSHFFWMVPLTATYGAVGAVSDIVKRIASNGERGRRVVGERLWRLFWWQLQTVTKIDDTSFRGMVVDMINELRATHDVTEIPRERASRILFEDDAVDAFEDVEA
jgi:hypothetical protein